ncbi:MAG TPA: M4 family metallopeptidase [Roseiflexaceae bacterium]|nr:M4 family metallopeptidase [Roseiflexaceae bacterium]
MHRLHPAQLALPLIALLIALSALPAAAAPGTGREPNPAALKAFQALQSRAGAPLEVVWEPQTGVAELLAARGTGRLPYTPRPSQQGDAVAIAIGFLEAHRTIFGLRTGELQLRKIEPDRQLGWHHVRLDQVYHGIPVFGRQLVVHLDEQLRVVSVNGQFQPEIDVPTEPAIGAQPAADAALRDLLERQLTPAERLRVQTNVLHGRTRLMVYVDGRGRATLTWYVTILTTSPLGQWRFFVHAGRPRVVHAFDSLANGKRRITYTAGNTTRLPGRKLIDEGERSRDRVAQAAHDGAGVVYDYYFENFQRDAIDDQGSPIISTVNFGSDAEDAENAAWIGELQQMVYGDGGEIFRPLSLGLDVVAHELTHGITDNTAGLIYQGQAGALNESYSDVFAALIDSDDWTMGEDVVLSPPYPTPVLRSLEDPNLGGRYDPNDPLGSVGQPAHVDEYANLPNSRRADNGGVHVNSGIPNRAAFLVAQAIGREKTGQIYYRTLTQYLTPGVDFFDAARATVRSAEELYGANEARAVRTAFAQVGLDVGGADTVPEQPAEDGPVVPGAPSGPATPTPEQLPAGCTNLIENGGFESDGDWVEVTAGEVAIIDPELPYTGERSAWLGGTDEEGVQFIYQEVRIPPNASSVGLRYFRLLHEELSGVLGTIAGDANFGTLFLNQKGDVVEVVEELTSAAGDDTWREAQFDVTKLAGKTLRLAFASENPRGNVSSMFVDDVSLVACTGGQAPPAPRPDQANTVFIQGTVGDANTRRGISGAQVFIIRPGLSASDAAADGTITDREVVTFATTDRRGQYQTEQAIPRGQTYSVIVVANGYRPIVADDGLEVPPAAENPFVVDATMRR